MSLKRWIFPNFIALTGNLCHSICHLWWQIFLKFSSCVPKKKRKILLLPCACFLLKTWEWLFSYPSRVTTAKKCTKIVMRVQSCYFAYLNLICFFPAERPCQGGSHFARLNFKTSCVSVYKCLSLIVGFAVTVAVWPREVVSCHDFILRVVATFWAMSLVGIYPGRASAEPHIYTQIKYVIKYVVCRVCVCVSSP